MARQRCLTPSARQRGRVTRRAKPRPPKFGTQSEDATTPHTDPHWYSMIVAQVPDVSQKRLHCIVYTGRYASSHPYHKARLIDTYNACARECPALDRLLPARLRTPTDSNREAVRPSVRPFASRAQSCCCAPRASSMRSIYLVRLSSRTMTLRYAPTAGRGLFAGVAHRRALASGTGVNRSENRESITAPWLVPSSGQDRSVGTPVDGGGSTQGL